MGVDGKEPPCVVGTCRVGHGCHSGTNIRGIYPPRHIRNIIFNINPRIPCEPSLSSLTWITLGNILTARPLSAVYPAFSIIPPPSLPLCFSSLSWVTSGNMVDRVDTAPALYIPGWLGRSVAQGGGGGGPWTIAAGHGLCDPRERFYLFIKYLDLWNWSALMGWEVLRGCFGEFEGEREGETILKVGRWFRFGCEINSREFNFSFDKWSSVYLFVVLRRDLGKLYFYLFRRWRYNQGLISKVTGLHTSFLTRFKKVRKEIGIIFKRNYCSHTFLFIVINKIIEILKETIEWI